MDDSHVEYDDADDDAARAFKRMMAGVVEVENKIGFGEEEAGEKDVWEKSQVEEDLYKEANKNLSALEKATGKKRKITGSLASQVEMFPELKVSRDGGGGADPVCWRGSLGPIIPSSSPLTPPPLLLRTPR